MRKRLFLALIAAGLMSGCTILPGSPGFDTQTGYFAFFLDLDDNGSADGLWTGCLSDPAMPKECGLAGSPQNSWWPFG